MKKKLTRLIACLTLPLAAGALSAFISRSGIERFAFVEKPPLTPPPWVFIAVWSVLYILMGAAYHTVLTSGKDTRWHTAVFVSQLAVNFLWPPIFFLAENYLLSMVWLALLFVLVTAMLILFWDVSKTAGVLVVPYLLWLGIAMYLAVGVYLLNL